jgi:hypothetical protein
VPACRILSTLSPSWWALSGSTLVMASVYLNIPQNELERSLTNNEPIPNDEGKKKLDDILNNTAEKTFRNLNMKNW